LANYFAQLPAYRDPGGLDFSPLNQAVQNVGETSRRNVMAEYQAGQDRRQNARADAAAGRAQSQFDEAKGKEALNQLGGIYQAIEAAPEAERGALYQRAQPMYDRLRRVIPDFDQDAMAAGVDPGDFRSLGRLLVGRQTGVQDPLARQETQADIGLKQAQAQYYNERPRTAAGGATTALIDRLMTDNPGMSLEEAITIAKRGSGFMEVGDELVNRNTGQTQRNVGDAIAGGKAAEQRGEAQGKAQADIPRIEANADRALKTIQQIRAHPGKKSGLGVTALSGYIPGTEARGFANLVDQAKGQTFLEAFNSLRGGGQITEAEGSKATQALARLDTAQTEEDFDAALKDLEDVVVTGMNVARRKAGPTATAPPASNDGWTDIGGVKIREKR
jgi:hypothetical protein